MLQRRVAAQLANFLLDVALELVHMVCHMTTLVRRHATGILLKSESAVTVACTYDQAALRDACGSRRDHPGDASFATALLATAS